MAMPSSFLFGLLLGILIAVEFLPSFQRILESLPEHDVTSSRRLADLLDLKHIAVQLLDTVGRDSFLVVVALGRLLLGFVLSMVLNAVFGVLSSKATGQLLILGTPGAVGTDRRRATAALRSRFLGPIVVVGIAGGAVAYLSLYRTTPRALPGSAAGMCSTETTFGSEGLRRTDNLVQQGNGSQDGSGECATDSLVEKLEKGLKSGLASIRELNCGATPTLGGDLSSWYGRLSRWKDVIYRHSDDFNWNMTIPEAWDGVTSTFKDIGTSEELNSVDFGGADPAVRRLLTQLALAAVVYSLSSYIWAFSVISERIARVSAFLRSITLFAARIGSCVLAIIGIMYTGNLMSTMWKMEVERAPADCGLQTEAYKALDAIADTGFLQCLLHSFVVAIKNPSASFQGPVRGSGSNLLAWPFLVLARMCSQACWLIALAPPSYIFWQAVSLRLLTSQDGAAWAQLLPLGVGAGLRLCLCAAQDGLPAWGLANTFSLAHACVDASLVASAFVPFFAAIPQVSRALVASKLHVGRFSPPWAAVLLLPVATVSIGARIRELGTSLGELSPVAASNAWLRGVLYNCGWEGGARPSATAQRKLRGKQHSIDDESKSAFGRLVSAVRRRLPKELKRGHQVEEILSLIGEIWMGSTDSKSSTAEGANVPLGEALNSALNPLGTVLSEVMRLVALPPMGRAELAEDIDKLKETLAELDSDQIQQFAGEGGPLQKACELLRPPAGRTSSGFMNIKGVLRLPMKPPHAVRIELIMVHEQTKDTIPLKDKEAICAIIADIATIPLPDGTVVHPVDGVYRDVRKKDGRAHLVIHLATALNQATMLDRFMDAKEVEAVKSHLEEKFLQGEWWSKKFITVQKATVVASDGDSWKAWWQGGPKLADGTTPFEVPIPLEKVQDALTKCQDATGADISRYKEATFYADKKEDLKVELGGSSKEDRVLHICVNLPGLGCTIFYVENMTVDVWLPELSGTDQLVEITSHLPDYEARKTGRLGELCIKLDLDQPTMLLGMTKLGFISESGECAKSREVQEPLSLEGGRYEVNASLMLEGGRSAAVQDADDEPVAGLFWGLKHPPFSNKAAEEAIWFHDEEGGFKGIDANRAELKDLVSKLTSGISHVPEAIARVAVALGMSVAKSTYLQRIALKVLLKIVSKTLTKESIFDLPTHFPSILQILRSLPETLPELPPRPPAEAPALERQSSSDI